jgi:hypothetical protein
MKKCEKQMRVFLMIMTGESYQDLAASTKMFLEFPIPSKPCASPGTIRDDESLVCSVFVKISKSICVTSCSSRCRMAQCAHVRIGTDRISEVRQSRITIFGSIAARR